MFLFVGVLNVVVFFSNVFSINLIAHRVGGGFGGKVLYSCIMSAAAALASYLINRYLYIYLA